MLMPNFLIIGASKAGTTALHNYLPQHPQVFLCPEKEVGFFWAHGERLDWQGPGLDRLKNRLVTDLQAYEKLFAGAGQAKAIGEASVRYLHHPRSPDLIKQFIPHARLVVILRQPADRAFSNFMHNRMDGIEPCADFQQVLAEERAGRRNRWINCRYLEKGYYFAALTRYLERFDRRQIWIGLFEDLRNTPQALMRSLYQFLDVDDGFVPDLSRRHNVSGVIRNPILRVAWARSGKLRAQARPFFEAGLRHRLYEWIIRDLDRQTLDADLRAELTELYRPDIERLQELIQRDLSTWLS